MGLTRQAREMISSCGKDRPLFRNLMTGWLEFVCGNIDDSLAAFQNALKLVKQRMKHSNAHIQAYPGLFYLLALLKRGNPDDFARALRHIHCTSKYRGNNPIKSVVLALEPLLKGDPDPPAGLEYQLTRNLSDTSRVDTFFFILARIWTMAAPPQKQISLLEIIRDRAQESGFFWLAAESAALLAKLGRERKTNSHIAALLHQKCGTVSFVDMVKIHEPWEKVLLSLIALNQDTAASENTREERLVWLFGYNEAYRTCAIVPKMQKKNKKGEWTRGRAVALKTLYVNNGTLNGLTDQDRLVCAAIVKSDYNYRYYNGDDFYFNMPKALTALVGHPHLMLESSPNIHVELVPGKPEVRIEKKKNTLHLSMNPLPDDYNKDVVVVKETPSRFKVVNLTPVHYKIAAQIKQNIAIPDAAGPLIKKTVDALSTLVVVQSDLAGSDQVKEIPADPTPHVHVMPFQEGIKVEFLVKPFGGSGSFFKPGKGGKIVLAKIDGEKRQTQRDLEQENKLFSSVVSDCPVLNRQESADGEWIMDDPVISLELLLELKACEDRIIMEWPQGEKLKVRREVSFDRLSMNICRQQDWFEATGKMQINDHLAVDLKRLMKMLENARGRFIPIDDGVFIAVTNELRKRLEELKAFSFPHGNGFRFSPPAALALEGLTENINALTTDAAWQTHCRNLATVIEPKIPSTFQANLREYQTAGFNWLAQLSHWGVGACLADDMGLGKTVQALAAVLLTAANGPSLVVAPMSVISNWVTECRRFAPTLVPVIFGPGDRQTFLDKLNPFDLVITSYGLLTSEAEKLCCIEWETVILDEAQAIKNMHTLRSKAAMDLKARFRIATTGTPVENHLGELWNLFNFLNPGLLGTFKQFNDRFIIPIERRQNREPKIRLRKLIRPFLLRRLKNDVLQELPPKTEITLEVEMSREEMLLYEAQRVKSLEAIEQAGDEPGQGRFRILAEITRLRRLCCNPSLVLPECDIPSSKLGVFEDIVVELLESNHKALVFSQFVGHLSLIRNLLDRKKISYQYLDGSTTQAQRTQQINAFQRGEGDLFLISLKAGGFGLNLTAADFVIHMDPWWNPAVEDQASDRAHRIGQQRPVTVYRLVVKDSIEEKIVGLHKEKRDLADSILAGSDMSARVSAEDLLHLLQNR